MIIVIDFGGQTAHLITRRLKELNSPAELITPEDALAFIDFHKPQGIILSGLAHHQSTKKVHQPLTQKFSHSISRCLIFAMVCNCVHSYLGAR